LRLIFKGYRVMKRLFGFSLLDFILALNSISTNAQIRDVAIKEKNINPEMAIAHGNRAVSYFLKKLYDLAILDYSKAVENVPIFALAYHDRRFANASEQQYGLAIGDYSKAIELDPKMVRAYKNRADVYEKTRTPDLAAADRKNIRN
jgi:tetratricopeptide (TPR) repeat protein